MAKSKKYPGVYSVKGKRGGEPKTRSENFIE
jgi:hypothetical protein